MAEVAEAEDLAPEPSIPDDNDSDRDVNDHYDQDSVASGTTALTSYSALELKSLDQDLMVDTLASLYDDSTKLVGNFLRGVGNDIEKALADLRLPDSMASKRLHRLLPKFESDLKCFGSDDYFIDITIASRGLLNVRQVDQIGNGPWRSDDVFRLANIVRTLSVLLPVSRTSPGAAQILRRLHTRFPALLAPKLGDQGWIDQAFEMGLELRTQLLIRTLTDYEQAPNFDPDEGLKEIFHVDPSGLRILGWGVDGLQNQDNSLPRRYIAKVEDRINIIRESFSTDIRAPVDFAALETAFPWQDFLLDLIRWSVLASDEIKKNVDRRGGIEDIVILLQEEIQRRRNGGAVTIQNMADAQATANWKSTATTEPVRASKVPTSPVSTLFRTAQPDRTLSKRLASTYVPTSEESGTAGRRGPNQTHPVTKAVAEVVVETAKSHHVYNSPADIKQLRNRMAALKAKAVQSTTRPSPAQPRSDAQPSSVAQPSSNAPRSRAAQPSRTPQPSSSALGTTSSLKQGQSKQADVTPEVAESEDEFRPQVDDEEDIRLQVDDDDEAPTSHQPHNSSSATVTVGFTQSTDQIMDALKAHEERNKENKKPVNDNAQQKSRFIDRQTGAQRMSFESQPRENVNSLAKRKRISAQEPEGDDDDEEDDYEHDDRTVGNERRQKRPRIQALRHSLAAVSRPTPSRAEHNDDEGYNEEVAEEDPTSVNSTLQRSSQQRSSAPAPRRRYASSQSAAPASSQYDHAAVNFRAKQNKAAAKPLRPQRRIRWTEEENDRLTELIGEYGLSWSFLKQMDEVHPDGPRLEDRDQVALKDKARNMLVDLLK